MSRATEIEIDIPSDIVKANRQPMSNLPVAERVSKVYPDRLVEIYIYGSYRKPPEYVHPNVLVNFCFHPSAPLNRPLLDTSIRFNRETVVNCLDGWQKAGAKQFEMYDYGEFFHMERPFFWFYSVVENLGSKECGF